VQEDLCSLEHLVATTTHLTSSLNNNPATANSPTSNPAMANNPTSNLTTVNNPTSNPATAKNLAMANKPATASKAKVELNSTAEVSPVDIPNKQPMRAAMAARKVDGEYLFFFV
jgi:hypothetical protein